MLFSLFYFPFSIFIFVTNTCCFYISPDLYFFPSIYYCELRNTPTYILLSAIMHANDDDDYYDSFPPSSSLPFVPLPFLPLKMYVDFQLLLLWLLHTLMLHNFRIYIAKIT